MKQILFWFNLMIFCDASDWAYFGNHGPNHWIESSKECGGLNQSPVDIITQEIEFIDLGDIIFYNFTGSTQEPVKILNNGHTLQLEFTSLQSFIASSNTRKSLLKGLYYLKQVHFHWGSSYFKGAEHTINGKRYSMEMHAVHINKETGKLAVVSKLFRAVQDSDDTLDDVLSNIIDIASVHVPDEKSYSANLDLSEHNIKTFLGLEGPDNKMDKFCTYRGSLTTPPCSEIVTWLIEFEIGSISELKLSELRGLHTGDTQQLVNNFRDTQPLNGRKVYCQRN